MSDSCKRAAPVQVARWLHVASSGGCGPAAWARDTSADGAERDGPPPAKGARVQVDDDVEMQVSSADAAAEAARQLQRSGAAERAQQLLLQQQEEAAQQHASQQRQQMQQLELEGQQASQQRDGAEAAAAEQADAATEAAEPAGLAEAQQQQKRFKEKVEAAYMAAAIEGIEVGVFLEDMSEAELDHWCRSHLES